MSSKIVQQEKIFRSLGIRDTKEAKNVLQVAFGFLLYLKDGEKLETANATFTKVTSDLVHISPNIDMQDVVTSLDRKNVIKLPF